MASSTLRVFVPLSRIMRPPLPEVLLQFTMQTVHVVDVNRLMVGGTFVYAYPFLNGTVQRHVYPYQDPSTFWVVEDFPSVVAGTIYEVRDDGLYTFETVILEQLLEKPPESYQKGEPILAVPSRIKVGETVRMTKEAASDQAAMLEHSARLEPWRDATCTVITVHADSGERVEQWWCEGTGLVKQEFLHPDAGYTELIEAKLR